MNKKLLVLLMAVVFILPFVERINDLLYPFRDTITYSTWSSSSFYEKKAIVNKGDTACYKHVVDSIRSHSQFGYYFYYSFVMAMKYDYTPANYDVYMSLADTYRKENEVGEMDDGIKELGVYFLRRGAVRGDQRCARLLSYLQSEQSPNNK